MVERLQLYVEGRIAAEHHGQYFFRGLDQALGPTRLLRLEGGHLDGQFGGALNVLQITEFPALHLRAIAKVGVFGQGVVLPATRSVNRGAAPHAGSPVEIEKGDGARSPAVLENKVTI